MGRISAPWLRQSARPRRTRRATLTSITGHPLWSGPRGVGAPPGRASDIREVQEGTMARIKLAYIGGGSKRAPGTMASFIDQAENFDGSEVVLIDLDQERLAVVEALAQNRQPIAGPVWWTAMRF